MKLFITSIIIITSLLASAAPDTARICTYNLLHYGQPGANRHDVKNLYLDTIFATMRPDIVTCLEVDTFLANAFDSIATNLPYATAHGSKHNTVNTDILDGLFWRTSKFALIRETIIGNRVRDIVAYDLYYAAQQPGKLTDTVFLKVITAHLKSSSSAYNRNLRDLETKTVAAYLAGLPDSSNVIMMGDFNLYTSSELAYQNLTNPTNIRGRLNDPLARPGDWDNDSTFADIHTQSPRIAQLGDYGAGGGLDSRFDFIIVSDAIMNGWKNIHYQAATYTAMGNDGRHFNKELTDAPNHPTLNQTIINALYYCSDHLPVYADFLINPNAYSGPVKAGNQKFTSKDISFTNPIGNSVFYNMDAQLGVTTYQLIDILGQVVAKGELEAGKGSIQIPAISPGTYIMKVISKDRVGTWELQKL